MVIISTIKYYWRTKNVDKTEPKLLVHNSHTDQKRDATNSRGNYSLAFKVLNERALSYTFDRSEEDVGSITLKVIVNVGLSLL